MIPVLCSRGFGKLPNGIRTVVTVAPTLAVRNEKGSSPIARTNLCSLLKDDPGLAEHLGKGRTTAEIIGLMSNGFDLFKPLGGRPLHERNSNVDESSKRDDSCPKLIIFDFVRTVRVLNVSQELPIEPERVQAVTRIYEIQDIPVSTLSALLNLNSTAVVCVGGTCGRQHWQQYTEQTMKDLHADHVQVLKVTHSGFLSCGCFLGSRETGKSDCISQKSRVRVRA